MPIYSKIQLLSVMFSAMMDAIDMPMPQWFVPSYIWDMQESIRHGIHVDNVAAHLYIESYAYWDLQDCLKIARMTETLWAMIKLTDLPERISVK